MAIPAEGFGQLVLGAAYPQRALGGSVLAADPQRASGSLHVRAALPCVKELLTHRGLGAA